MSNEPNTPSVQLATHGQTGAPFMPQLLYMNGFKAGYSTTDIDNQASNPDQSSCNAPRGRPRTLQDDCLTQEPVFVGLISMVTGSTLQEDIAATTRQLLLRGPNILGGVRPETNQTTA